MTPLRLHRGFKAPENVGAPWPTNPLQRLFGMDPADVGVFRLWLRAHEGVRIVKDGEGGPEMTPPVRSRLSARSPVDLRRRVRYLTAALCAGIGLLYVALLFLVADAEAGAAENTYGAYLFLSVPYLVGAVLSVMADRQVLWIAGAAFQVVVIGLFAMFGAGLFGPGQGVFGYDALAGLHMELWATVITGAQVVLFGLQAYLALSRIPRLRSAANT